MCSRFKQIKEEEARRRRQREEENRKAEEAIAKGTEVTNGKSNEVGVDLVEKNETHQSENTIHNSSSGGATVNGNLFRPDLNENGNTTVTLHSTEKEVLKSLKVADMEKEQPQEYLIKV